VENKTSGDCPPEDTGPMRPLLLMAAIAMMIAVTIWPPWLTDADGKADHWAAFALFWAMSAGFISGVGFRPRFVLWRWLFSSWAFAIGIALALLRLYLGT